MVYLNKIILLSIFYLLTGCIQHFCAQKLTLPENFLYVNKAQFYIVNNNIYPSIFAYEDLIDTNQPQTVSSFEISADDFKKLSVQQLTQRESVYEILSFRLIVDKPHQFSEVLNTGKEFSELSRRLIESVNPGDSVTVESINAVVNGEHKKLPSLFYKIR